MNLIEYKPQEEKGKSEIIPIHSPLDMPLEQFKTGLKRREKNRKALIEWIWSNLVRGIDFGSIHFMSKNKCSLGANCKNPHHWSKPSLFKPGAEKICGLLGLIPRFANHDKYEQAAYTGVKIFQVILRCELHTASGFIAGEGIGARSLAKDSQDINKSLKMAEKSAMIDAVLRVAGLSELFTQDIEDMNMGARESSKTPSRKHSPTQKQKDLIFQISSSSLFTDDERQKIDSFCENPKKTMDAASKMIDWLKSEVEKRRAAEKAEEKPAESEQNATAEPEPMTEEQARSIQKSLDYYEIKDDKAEKFIEYVEKESGFSRHCAEFAEDLTPNFASYYEVWSNLNK